MIAALLVLVLSGLMALALGSLRPYAALARLPALVGTGIALLLSLYSEGPVGGGVAGTVVPWTPFLGWLGEPVYRSDALSAGLGAWCLLLGGLCLMGVGGWGSAADPDRQNPNPYQVAAGTFAIATLYSLVHTWDLGVFAAQMLLLVPLVWALNGAGETGEDSREEGRHLPALGLGAAAMLGAALVIGRTTGGEYTLTELSLSALTRWPLALIALGAALWMGFAPLTGWSLRGHREGPAVLVQALVVGVPVIVLLLRLQALLTTQGLAGSVPEGWEGFTTALAWAGGFTALVAGAGSIVTAGTPRWTAMLSAQAWGLAVWALSLDNPPGRTAALAILLAFGAARVTLHLASDPRPSPVSALVASFSMAAAPLTAGFVGLWLLGSELAQEARPSLVIALAGAALLAACGSALHIARLQDDGRWTMDDVQTPYVQPSTFNLQPSTALLGAAALILGGILPSLWLPFPASMASVAGGAVSSSIPGELTGAGGLLGLPALLGLAAIALAGLGWLLRSRAKSGAMSGGVLLPTALGHLQTARQNPGGPSPQQTQNSEFRIQNSTMAPLPVWLLSLEWLDTRLWGFGELLARLGTRAGLGLGRLEGRYYVPLVLVLTLIALLAATR